MALKAFLIWCVILLLAIANGALREALLVPRLGASVALLLSGILLGLLIFFTSWLAIPWFGPRPARHFLAVGVCWLLMTVSFEFAFGRLVMQKDWATLFAAYDPSGGNLWIAILVLTTFSPLLAAKVRRVCIA